MGEAAKVIFNALGWTAVGLGFIANIFTHVSSAITVTLGLVGIVFLVAQTLEKIEHYRIKRIERIRMQDEDLIKKMKQ